MASAVKLEEVSVRISVRKARTKADLPTFASPITYTSLPFLVLRIDDVAAVIPGQPKVRKEEDAVCVLTRFVTIADKMDVHDVESLGNRAVSQPRLHLWQRGVFGQEVGFGADQHDGIHADQRANRVQQRPGQIQEIGQQYDQHLLVADTPELLL